MGEDATSFSHIGLKRKAPDYIDVVDFKRALMGLINEISPFKMGAGAVIVCPHPWRKRGKKIRTSWVTNNM